MLDFRKKFNAAGKTEPGTNTDLILAIRSDAAHASKTLSTNIKNHIKTELPTSELSNDEVVDGLVHSVYTKWLTDVVEIMGKYLNTDEYNLTSRESSTIEANYYSAETLEAHAIENAEDYWSDANMTFIYVSNTH